jgi:tRNA A-37 threonylcarbamoyl transferase component Bud32
MMRAVTVRIGELFRDRYQVLEKIGEGAFAYVYRAREEAAGRDVALKVLKEPYQQVRDVVERFQREVFAAASVSSPHVVALYDFGFLQDEFFIVMEFVRGPSLRQLLVHEPWAPGDVLVVIGQIAHALQAAHQKEIVHRDLKPENVMLVERSGSWQAKVLDFGFAKLAELERTLQLEPITMAGMCFGTPQYLSPEQIRGRPVDGGADLFALGVMAYEMLAGERPWDGPDARTIMTAVLKSLPPPVLRPHPSLMPRLEELNRFLLRALEKERAQRPPDAVAFFEELQVALYGSAQAARAALGTAPEVAPAALPPPIPADAPLPGARPQTLMEDVTSRSIVLRVTPAMGNRQRFDTTEIDAGHDDRRTTTFTTARAGGGDTEPQRAMDPSIVVEDASIPIFVADPKERLPSQYLPRIDVDDDHETRPHATAVVPKVTPQKPWAVRVAVAALVTVLLALAFLAGRYWK